MARKIYSYAERLGIGRSGRKRLSYDRFERRVRIPINYIYRGEADSIATTIAAICPQPLIHLIGRLIRT